VRLKELRARAAGQRATAAVPHKVTGLAGEHRKRLAIKEIAGATFPRGATDVAPLAPRIPLQADATGCDSEPESKLSLQRHL
jgi:hypothetical protein